MQHFLAEHKTFRKALNSKYFPQPHLIVPPDRSNNASISVVNSKDQYQSIAIMQFHIAIATHVCLRTCFKEVSRVQLDTWVSRRLGKDESTDHFHTSNESFTLFIKALRHPAATHKP